MTGSTGYKSEVSGQSHGPATGTAGKHTQSENAKPVSRRGAEKWDTDQQEWEMPMVPLRLWRCFSLIAVEKKVTEELTESLDVA